jgi:hypothetical protein
MVGANLFVAALHPKCMQRLIDQWHDPNLPLSLTWLGKKYEGTAYRFSGWDTHTKNERSP